MHGKTLSQTKHYCNSVNHWLDRHQDHSLKMMATDTDLEFMMSQQWVIKGLLLRGSQPDESSTAFLILCIFVNAGSLYLRAVWIIWKDAGKKRSKLWIGRVLCAIQWWPKWEGSAKGRRYAYTWLIHLLYSRNQHNILKFLITSKINFKIMSRMIKLLKK